MKIKEKSMEQKNNKIELERRSITLKELRVLEAENSAPKTIEGYAAVFDSWSEALGGNEPFIEKVCKGAFEQSIIEDDIRALFNHDPNYVLGRNKSGTLTLQEDEKGLLVRINPPNNQWANDLLVSIARGDITQMSFGFTVESDRWSFENNKDIRELVKVRLFDVSPVTFPAYTQTECGLRSVEEVYKSHSQVMAEKREQEVTKRKNILARTKQKFKFL